MNKEVTAENSNCNSKNVSQLDTLNTPQQGGESENLDQNTTQTERITDSKPTTEEEKLYSTELLAFTEDLRREFIEESMAMDLDQTSPIAKIIQRCSRTQSSLNQSYISEILTVQYLYLFINKIRCLEKTIEKAEKTCDARLEPLERSQSEFANSLKISIDENDKRVNDIQRKISEIENNIDSQTTKVQGELKKNLDDMLQNRLLPDLQKNERQVSEMEIEKGSLMKQVENMEKEIDKSSKLEQDFLSLSTKLEQLTIHKEICGWTNKAELEQQILDSQKDIKTIKEDRIRMGKKIDELKDLINQTKLVPISLESQLNGIRGEILELQKIRTKSDKEETDLNQLRGEILELKDRYNRTEPIIADIQTKFHDDVVQIIRRVHNDNLNLGKRMNAFWENRKKSNGLDLRDLKQEVFGGNYDKKKFNFIKVDANENNFKITSQNNNFANIELINHENEASDLSFNIRKKQIKDANQGEFFPECFYRVGKNGREITFYFQKNTKDYSKEGIDENPSCENGTNWRGAYSKNGSPQASLP